MPYSKDPSDYTPHALYEVAEKHYVQRMTHEAISEESGIRPRAKVVAMCEAARAAGMVYTTVIPSATNVNIDELTTLASRLREKFGLLHCVLVHGKREMLSEEIEPGLREAIVDNIARRAASEIERRFHDTERPALAVSFGYMTRKIANHLRPEGVAPRKGEVIAAQGVRSIRMDRFDANDIVRGIARQFGCEYMCMPAPALVNKEDAVLLNRIPMIKVVLDKLDQKANIVLASLGSRMEIDPSAATEYDSHSGKMFSDSEREAIANKGGVGNIGGIWFDKHGNEIDCVGRKLIGLRLERMKKLVEDGKPVILATGADVRRIPALYVALRTKLCNVWIGDQATAMALLGDWKISEHYKIRKPSQPDTEIIWQDHEREVLQDFLRT